MNLTNLFWDGIYKDREEHEDGEKKKLGNLRAGDTGVMTRQGDIVGACPRRAYVRSFLGLESEPPERENLLMFELGKANELIWVDKLKKSWPGTIKQEEEIPIKWTTKSGTNVTGRPDVVLCDAGGNPKIGIEHKAVCSLWTARDVSFELVPKTKHLFQAAHYAWKLGIPYYLVYTQYTNYAIPGDWAAKMFPVGHPLVELSDKGKPKHVRPHVTIYNVGITKEGYIRYGMEGEAEWITTPWSVEDIERYYEFVVAIKERKVLGARPLTKKVNGDKAGYSDCNYCPLKETCDNYENNWEGWNEEVKKQCVKK